MRAYHTFLTLYASTPENGQTHSNNSLAKADKLFDCLTIFWDWCLKG